MKQAILRNLTHELSTLKNQKKNIKENSQDTSKDPEEFHTSSEDGRMLDYGHQKSDADEGLTIKQFLQNISVDAYELHQMIKDEDDLPQWCQYKIAQAQEMVQSVRNYLQYKIERMDSEETEEVSLEDSSKENTSPEKNAWHAFSGFDDGYDGAEEEGF